MDKHNFNFKNKILEKVIYLAILIGLSLTQKIIAQFPEGLPDGITVGAGATIP